MKYYVYLLVSAIHKNKIYSYVGYAKDLKKRLDLHNSSKGAKFTKGKKWYLAYKKTYFSKATAMKNEYKLKKNIKLRYKLKKDFINSI